MSVFFAILPVIIALLLLTRFKFSPGTALPIAWGISLLTGHFLWRMPARALCSQSLYGALKSLDILCIIFGAVLLLNILKESGAFLSIKNTFTGLSDDRRIQALIIAWLFSNFLEGAAGFGAAPVLAAPLLVGLGFPVMPALVVSLICNSIAVPFGAVGTPFITLNALLQPCLAAIGVDSAGFSCAMMRLFTFFSAILGTLVPFIAVSFMVGLSGDRDKLRSCLDIAPLAIAAGLLHMLPWVAIARWVGPELPSVFGALIAMPLMILLLKTGWLTPKRVWRFPEEEASASTGSPSTTEESPGKAIPLWQSWMPYGLIAIILLLTRLPMLPLKGWLNAAGILHLPCILGIEGTALSWNLLMNPGIFPFIPIAVGAAILYRMPPAAIWGQCTRSLRQIRSAAWAIAASFAMVQIMITSDSYSSPGMLITLAGAAADSMGRCYLLAAPILGLFGTFFAGSCTLSNILFGALQFNAAHHIGLSEPLVIALQTIGGGLGSMLRLSGIVAACATVKAQGKEGRLLILNLIPAAIMLLLAWIIAWFFL